VHSLGLAWVSFWWPNFFRWVPGGRRPGFVELHETPTPLLTLLSRWFSYARPSQHFMAHTIAFHKLMR